VVIAGMGDTGVLAGISLAPHAEVIGVSTRPALVSGQELGNRVADPEHWRRNFLVPLRRFRRLDGVRLLHGRITRADLERSQVHVELANGARKVVPYDHLIVATGVTNGFWRHDRVEDLDAIEAELDAVSQELAEAQRVAVVGGGPTGVSAAANLARRHPATDVHLFYAGDEPLPGYHPRARRRIVVELERAGVQLHPGHRAEVPDGFAGDRLTAGPLRWTSGQEPVDAEVVLWATGRVRPHTAFLPDEVLDEAGFVRVDEHLRVPGHANVWAVGDVAATDPARSSARNWGFLVLTRNLRATVAGRTERLRRFRAPEHRWGSILGLQDDGLLVFQPDGKAVRVPKRLVQPLLFDLYLRLVLYRGIRR
jgi:NADH dehydrogenase FAD-containing subunit